MARTYEELRAAVDQLIMLESDKEVSDMAFAEAMARLDEYYITKEATEAGHAEGLAKGLAEGRAKGLAEGRAERKN